ncbi:hypothetical protein ACQ143_12215 [Microbacterium sp. MC2]
MARGGVEPNPEDEAAPGESQGFAHTNGFNSSLLSDRFDYDGFDEEGRYHFADRFVLAESWRIAAEVVSRHPELRISRVEDGDQNALLLLHRGATGWRAQFDLFSGIGYEHGGEYRRHSWLTVFSQHDPLAVIKRLQVASGLRIIPAKRGETGHSSAYQAIASILGLHVSSRSTWQAIPVRLFDGQDVKSDTAALSEFPSAMHAADDYIAAAVHDFQSSSDDLVVYWHEPLWFLYEGFQVRAIVDEAGWVHVTGGASPIDIRATHAACGPSWSLTAAHIYEIIDSPATDAQSGQSPRGRL